MSSCSPQERAAGLICWSSYPGIKVVPVADVQADLGLGEGRTNQNFVATTADGSERFFVRIGVDLPVYGVTRVKEQAAARAVASSGVGATVIHAELPDVLVTTFVAGRALTDAQVKAATSGEDTELLHALTATIRRLHGTPIPTELLPTSGTPPQRWYPLGLQHWIEVARAGGYSRLPLLADVDSLLESAEASMAPWQLAAPAFCHFDLLCDNFVVDDQRPSGGGIVVTIVDFEYCDPGRARWPARLPWPQTC
jgi:thiamine kinase-like enzyme